jgi:hypothetical protein
METMPYETNRTTADPVPASPGREIPLLTIAGITAILHIAVNLAGGYGFFRDELYYIACTDHMAWGYVDQPPFSIAVLWVSRLIFGDSLVAVRLLPAIASGSIVYLAGRIARDIGGNTFSEILAATLVVIAPQMLGTGAIFSMNIFDILFWTLSAWLFVRITAKHERKDFLILGIVVGLGLMNKISMLWLIAGLGAGIVIAGDRQLLKAPYFWAAAGIAFVIFLPHCIWQVIHRLPTVEFMHNASAGKYAASSPLDLLKGFSLAEHPLSLPFWVAGLGGLLFMRSFRPWRALGVMACTVFVILSVNGTSKAEYMAPLFPLLAAAGAVISGWIIHSWVRPVAVAVLAAAGFFLAPVALPVLPVASYITWQQKLGIQPGTSERKEIGALPQHYADMFGWEEMTAAVAAVYDSLSPSEKAACRILTNNYGEAGAIDFFGRRFHLPPALCGHNNYWYWGPGDATGEVIIRIGGKLESIRDTYSDATVAAVFRNPYCMPYENNLPIILCRHRHYPIQEDWPAFRHFE